ncbi:MAG: hypothetical protein AAF517_12020 [Planctomycetota bacterium]
MKHYHVDAPIAYFRKKMRIGFWKTRIVARYPDKAIKDSHTPWSLKFEMLIAPLFICAVTLSVISTVAKFAAVGLGLAFLASNTSYCKELLPDRAQLAWRSPFFLFLRGAALFVGVGYGICSKPFEAAKEERRMESLTPKDDPSRSTATDSESSAKLTETV